MRFYIGLAAIIGIFAALVAAAQTSGFAWPWTSATHEDTERCMTVDEAHAAADIFRKLIQEYSHELALEALTEDFVDWASSVNILINKGAAGPKSMNAPTFASRAAFMDGQGKQPQIPFETIKVFPGCRHVAMRWKTDKSANGHATEVDTIPVHGNVIVEVEPAEPGNRYNWRVSNIWSEFNSAAWLVNLGVFKPGGIALEKQDVQHMQEFNDELPARKQELADRVAALKEELDEVEEEIAEAEEQGNRTGAEETPLPLAADKPHAVDVVMEAMHRQRVERVEVRTVIRKADL